MVKGGGGGNPRGHRLVFKAEIPLFPEQPHTAEEGPPAPAETFCNFPVAPLC